MFEKKIPFYSWDCQTDPCYKESVIDLESVFGPAAIAFNSYQNAIAAIMEILGSRTQAIPVVMSISTAPDTIAGVLRGGGNPLLLDIDPTTLQINPDMLSEVLDEIEAAVVVLSRPAGIPVDSRLIEMVKDLPTILDTKDIPTAPNTDYTFSVYDFQAIIGSGALVIHMYKEQIRDLKMVRSGLLGLSADMNPVVAAHLADTYRKHWDGTTHLAHSSRKKIAEKYAELLGERSFVQNVEPHLHWPYFMVKVENADRVIAHLHDNNITAMKPVVPLHLFSEMARRWTEPPEYPVAEELHQKLVALPTNCMLRDKEEFVVEKLLEVAD